MIKVTTVEFRNNLKEILKKANEGEQVVLKYYNKEYTLRSSLSEPKATYKRVSPQVSKIISHFDESSRKKTSLGAKDKFPDLYDMTPEEEKEYIRSERAKRYGL